MFIKTNVAVLLLALCGTTIAKDTGMRGSKGKRFLSDIKMQPMKDADGIKALQSSSCSAEESRYLSCLSRLSASQVNACATCIDGSFPANPTGCSDLDDYVCNAPSRCCDDCGEEITDYFQCLGPDVGCTWECGGGGQTIPGGSGSCSDEIDDFAQCFSDCASSCAGRRLL